MSDDLNNKDYNIGEENNEWPAFQARLRKAATDILGNSKDGAAIILSITLMNNEGDPLVWVVPRGLLIEPRRSALKTIVHYLLGQKL